jgi:hypothetical protein
VGKSKRNSPKPGSARQEKLAARRAEREEANQVPTRPFAGLACECDLVALREFVPSATAPLPLLDADAAPVTLATVLPGAVRALVREYSRGGVPGVERFAALQTRVYSQNAGADLAGGVEWAAAGAKGSSLDEAVGASPAITSVIDPGAKLDIAVHSTFNWWIPDGVEPEAQVVQAVEAANQIIMPTARIEAEGVEAAWWVDAGERAHLRWVRPEDEDQLMAALARLQAARTLSLGEDSRFAGVFRTNGLLVPVFDLDREKHPSEWAGPIAELGERLAQALAVDAPLSSDERRARDGIRGRQVTIR